MRCIMTHDAPGTVIPRSRLLRFCRQCFRQARKIATPRTPEGLAEFAPLSGSQYRSASRHAVIGIDGGRARKTNIHGMLDAACATTFPTTAKAELPVEVLQFRT